MGFVHGTGFGGTTDLRAVPGTDLPTALATNAVRSAEALWSEPVPGTAEDLALAGEITAARRVAARITSPQARRWAQQTVERTAAALAALATGEEPPTAGDPVAEASQLHIIALQLIGAHPFAVSQNQDVRSALDGELALQPHPRTAVLDAILRRWEAVAPRLPALSKRSSLVDLGMVLAILGDQVGAHRVLAAASEAEGQAPRLAEAWLRLEEPEPALQAAREEDPRYRVAKLAAIARFLLERGRTDAANAVIAEAYAVADALTPAADTLAGGQLGAYRVLVPLQAQFDREGALRRAELMPGLPHLRPSEAAVRGAEALSTLGERDAAVHLLRSALRDMLAMKPNSSGQREQALAWIGVEFFRAGRPDEGLAVLGMLETRVRARAGRRVLLLNIDCDRATEAAEHLAQALRLSSRAGLFLAAAARCAMHDRVASGRLVEVALAEPLTAETLDGRTNRLEMAWVAYVAARPDLVTAAILQSSEEIVGDNARQARELSRNAAIAAELLRRPTAR